MRASEDQTPPAGLPDWWVSAPGEGLSPWALAQVWALLRVSEQFGLDMSDAKIAEHVTKADGEHPTKQCVQKIRVTIGACVSKKGWPRRPHAGATSSATAPPCQRLDRDGACTPV